MTRMRRALGCALILCASLVVSPANATTLALPDFQGPKVPAVTAPTIVNAFDRAPFNCWASGARSTTIAVPPIVADRVLLVVTIEPDGDPWDRLFGVAIGGVEVMRGTTPRAPMTLRKDITEFASLLPPGGMADVSLNSGSYVGNLLESVSLEFYSSEPTAALARAPAAAVLPSVRWQSLTGDGTSVGAPVTFPATSAAAATLELTITGHGGSGEFWYLDDPVPRAFHVLVDGHEVAVARSMPYVYALLGFGNDFANTACLRDANGDPQSGTSAEGDLLHPLMWWTAQQVADALGVHSGTGEIPPYRAELDAADIAFLTGPRTVTVVQEGGGSGPDFPQDWPASLAFLLR